MQPGQSLELVRQRPQHPRRPRQAHAGRSVAAWNARPARYRLSMRRACAVVHGVTTRISAAFAHKQEPGAWPGSLVVLGSTRPTSERSPG